MTRAHAKIFRNVRSANDAASRTQPRIHAPHAPRTWAASAACAGAADMVQRFVDASIIGWYNYLYGNNHAANELIKRDNPLATDDVLAHALAALKDHDIVDSGEARDLGIGAMSDARMRSFFDKMVKAGVVKADLDYRKAYTLRFVNKKVGMDLRRN
jgi:NitT/TauT family transport system substrate-binding protein